MTQNKWTPTAEYNAAGADTNHKLQTPSNPNPATQRFDGRQPGPPAARPNPTETRAVTCWGKTEATRLARGKNRIDDNKPEQREHE